MEGGRGRSVPATAARRPRLEEASLRPAPGGLSRRPRCPPCLAPDPQSCGGLSHSLAMQGSKVSFNQLTSPFLPQEGVLAQPSSTLQVSGRQTAPSPGRLPGLPHAGALSTGPGSACPCLTPARALGGGPDGGRKPALRAKRKRRRDSGLQGGWLLASGCLRFKCCRRPRLGLQGCTCQAGHTSPPQASRVHSTRQRPAHGGRPVHDSHRLPLLCGAASLLGEPPPSESRWGGRG